MTKTRRCFGVPETARPLPAIRPGSNLALAAIHTVDGWEIGIQGDRLVPAGPLAQRLARFLCGAGYMTPHYLTDGRIWRLSWEPAGLRAAGYTAGKEG